MRLSMLEGDPGYNPVLGLKAKVLLNGAEIKDCVTADEEAGLAIIYTLDCDATGEPVTAELHGVVSIQIG